MGILDSATTTTTAASTTTRRYGESSLSALSPPSLLATLHLLEIGFLFSLIFDALLLGAGSTTEKYYYVFYIPNHAGTGIPSLVQFICILEGLSQLAQIWLWFTHGQKKRADMFIEYIMQGAIFMVWVLVYTVERQHFLALFSVFFTITLLKNMAMWNDLVHTPNTQHINVIDFNAFYKNTQFMQWAFIACVAAAHFLGFLYIVFSLALTDQARNTASIAVLWQFYLVMLAAANFFLCLFQR